MDGQTGTRKDGKESNVDLIYKGQEVVENLKRHVA